MSHCLQLAAAGLLANGTVADALSSPGVFPFASGEEALGAFPLSAQGNGTGLPPCNASAVSSGPLLPAAGGTQFAGSRPAAWPLPHEPGGGMPT